ncbi:MAG: hypothetical protein K2J10_11810, partial [Muribaculaceae bacterium]|nr:hypothetical protein [Muribaculaceae bacterium]
TLTRNQTRCRHHRSRKIKKAFHCPKIHINKTTQIKKKQFVIKIKIPTDFNFFTKGNYIRLTVISSYLFGFFC